MEHFKHAGSAIMRTGRITGAIRFSRVWAIPKDAPKPKDPRLKQSKESNGGSL